MDEIYLTKRQNNNRPWAALALLPRMSCLHSFAYTKAILANEKLRINQILIVHRSISCLTISKITQQKVSLGQLPLARPAAVLCCSASSSKENTSNSMPLFQRIKIMMKLFAFLSFTVVTCSAIEPPEGFLRHKASHQALHDFERQLAQGAPGEQAPSDSSTTTTTDGACGAKLSMCEAVTQDMAFPAQKWIDFLEEMDGNTNDTLVDDLVQLIELSQSANFNPVVTTVHNNSNAQTVLTVIRDTTQEVKNIEQADPTGGIATMVDALTRIENVLTVMGAPVPEQSIDLVIFLLTFTAGLLELIGGSPVEIVVYVIQQVIVFVTTFLAGLFAIAIFPTADTECQSELMLCNYVKMMLDVVPGLVGSIFIAETAALS